MKKLYLKWAFTLVLSVLLTMPMLSQSGKSLWNKTTQNAASKKELTFRKTEPSKADFYKLDINALKTELQAAPNRNTFSGISNVILDFPNVQGTLESYRIKEAPIMEAALQNKYPDIRTYIGESIDTPGTVIRFSLTSQGLHTMSMSNNNGTQFIDPYTKNGNEYIVYAKKDLPVLDQNWECGVVDGELIEGERGLDVNMQRNADDGLLRNFRLVVATTIEYSSFHWMAAGLTAADTEAARRTAVMAAIVVTINRNNQIYERDLSITMTLVGNNDSVVFINSDNFDNNNPGLLINQSQTVIDNIIMPGNYDIGHTFSTGGGGLAQLGSVCGGGKARGITGLPSPVGDSYDIDFVAHEFGHQFGAPHTFNGNAGANTCASQRSASNAYEVGSGTTIMAYAGICAPQNVQGNSDAYFHQKSLQMIWDNVTIGNSQCASTTNTGNNAPTSNAGADFTIPFSTPYKLTGSSTDADGTGTHTYTWEQYDLGPTGLPADTNTSGPMVRSYEGTSSPSRYIPILEDIISFGGVSSTWEKLASVARTQDFRLTVRDNDISGGQTAVDEMTVTVNGNDGPFLVTSQNVDGISWTAGNTETITWDVAGTNVAPGVNTPNVNILLSTDGGVNFDTVLASNVPNDGSHDIMVPNIQAAFCRIMVEGEGNIFFNVNDTDFAIGTTVVTTCTTYSSAQNLGLAIADGTGTVAAPGQGTPLFNSINIPDSNTITSITISADVTHPNTADLLLQFQHPDVGTNNAFVNIWIFDCVGDSFNITFDDLGAPINCGSPTTGTFAPVNPLGAILNDLNSFGDWNLALVDFVSGNTGTLNNWSIEICSISTGLSIDEFELNNLSIYPNPNNGEFNVKFNSISENVSLQVFDIRGRSVYNKSYANSSSSFNEAINLGNVQSGMYLLNVNDGERTITKKIIVD